MDYITLYPNDVKLENISIVVQNSYSNFYLPINYIHKNETKKLLIQTPKIFAPFGTDFLCLFLVPKRPISAPRNFRNFLCLFLVPKPPISAPIYFWGGSPKSYFSILQIYLKCL